MGLQTQSLLAKAARLREETEAHVAAEAAVKAVNAVFGNSC